MIWKIISATATTAIAFATNFYIGEIWVREGLDADTYGTYQPMQPHEIVLFALSGIIAFAVPAFTAAWLAIRAGKNPPLTAVVLAGCVALAILVYGPGLLTSFFG